MATGARVLEVFDNGAQAMLERIRASLEARAKGENFGGDIEVMRWVDEIVRRESPMQSVGGQKFICIGLEPGPTDCAFVIQKGYDRIRKRVLIESPSWYVIDSLKLPFPYLALEGTEAYATLHAIYLGAHDLEDVFA